MKTNMNTILLVMAVTVLLIVLHSVLPGGARWPDMSDGRAPARAGRLGGHRDSRSGVVPRQGHRDDHEGGRLTRR